MSVARCSRCRRARAKARSSVRDCSKHNGACGAQRRARAHRSTQRDTTNMAQSWFGTRLRAIAGALTLSLAAAGAHAASITLYSAQHEQVVNMLAKDFEKE